MEEALKLTVLESTNYQLYRILKLQRGLLLNKDSIIKDYQKHRVLVDTIQTITTVVEFIYFQILKIKVLIK
jgi:hypothetical protein